MPDTVFFYRPGDPHQDGDAWVFASDGKLLGSWFSSNAGWSMHDTARFVPPGADVVRCWSRAELQAEIDAGRLAGVEFAEEASDA